MTKLLLINPEIPDFSFNTDKVFFLPEGLMGLATLVETKGVEVHLLDLNVVKFKRNLSCEETILNLMREFKPDLVGIGCLFSGQFNSVLVYSKLIKETYPHIGIVIGGMHPTLFHTQILENCPSIDYVAIAEGESALLELIRYIQGKTSLDAIPSFAYRNISQVVVNLQKKTILDINTLPINDYSLLDLKDYYHEETSEWHNPKKLPINGTVSILTSRGCPLDCNFCCLHDIMGKKMRYRSAKHVVDEIELVYNTYNHSHFSFIDDNLVIKKKHIIGICNEILKRNLNIQFDTPNGVAINYIDEEVLSAMMSVGMTRLSLPIEHGSNYMRNEVIRKNLTEKKIYDVVGMTKKYKQLIVRAFFIMGFPEDTPETLEDTYRMIEGIDVDRPIVNNLMPYAGTDLFNQCARDHLFVDNIRLDDMWMVGDLNFSANRNFFVKPYNMGINELMEFRKQVDELTTKNIERKKYERNLTY